MEYPFCTQHLQSPSMVNQPPWKVLQKKKKKEKERKKKKKQKEEGEEIGSRVDDHQGHYHALKRYEFIYVH